MVSPLYLLRVVLASCGEVEYGCFERLSWAPVEGWRRIVGAVDATDGGFDGKDVVVEGST